MLDISPYDYAHKVSKGVEPADSDTRFGRNVLGHHVGGEHGAGMALLFIDSIYDLDQAVFWLHRFDLGISLMLIRKQLKTISCEYSLDDLFRRLISRFHLEALLLFLLVNLNVEGHASVYWQLLLDRLLLD